MKTNSSVLIAALTLTAIVLGVVMLATPSRDAQAMMVTNTPSLTMMTTGQAQGGDEMLVIIDKGTGKMLVYRIDGNNFELMGSQNMAQLFGAAVPAPAH